MSENSIFESSKSLKPLYEHVYDYLDTLIAKSEPGDKLPSEKELETKLNVSKVTIRHAYQMLEFEKRIIKVAGKGSFVAKPRIEPLTALTGFSENIRAKGYHPSYANSKVTFPIPKKEILEFFEINNPSNVMKIFRVMCADNSPLGIQHGYYPIEVFNKNKSLFIPEVLNQISIYRILELELDIKLARADEFVDASLADRDEAEILRINTGDPILDIIRKTYDENGQPIEFVNLIYPSEKYRYKVELFRQ